MFKNKKFAKYAVAFLILGVFFNFFYSGLQNDQINIIQGFSAWSSTSTQLPMTVGNFVCIVLTFIYGSCFIKFGVRKTLIPCIGVSALGCLGIALANGLACNDGVGNYPLFFISLFLVRISCMCFQMAGFQLAASWFIKYRGSVLGFVTLGSPLFSVVGTSGMTQLINSVWKGDYRPFYVGVCILLVIIAICVALFLRDTPEEVGLYPDGAETKPKSEENDDIKLSVGQVLKQKKAWILIANFGCYNFVINACMASMVVWFMHLANQYADVIAAGPLAEAFAGAGPMVLFGVQAAKWLSVGAILGIPISFLFGVIDDHVGTPIACVILGITCILPPLCLGLQENAVASTGSCNVPLLILWGFGVACMTGGVPTMHPASIGYGFGRREYQAANRIIMSIQLIPSAVAAYIMAAAIDAGNGFTAWMCIIAVAVVGIIASFMLFSVEDANAADRIYGQKKA